jgi:hypothetical protein
MFQKGGEMRRVLIAFSDSRVEPNSSFQILLSKCQLSLSTFYFCLSSLDLRLAGLRIKEPHLILNGRRAQSRSLELL